jgi:hypothetical protein
MQNEFELIKPKNVMVKDGKGVEKEFVISLFPESVGPKILASYPLSNPKNIADYSSFEPIYLIFQYVGVPVENGGILRLETPLLLQNHVLDIEQLIRLEFEMLQYNYPKEENKFTLSVRVIENEN